MRLHRTTNFLALKSLILFRMEHEGVRDESYRVGWICSFPFELEAALMMLDEESADLPPTANNTPDGYWKGRISGHNIVIAGPPEGMLGVMSAAVTVSQMLLRFKSIRFALIVGIGSGVPSDANDVRLGDVVVSQPRMTQGGVIQYDIGRDFVRTGFVNSPPSVLLDALATVQDNTSYLTEYLSSLPKEFARDHTWPDNLFEPTYRHVQGERTCDMCDKSRLAERRPRQSHDPKVHFGTIASGNHVIKDGNLRDRLSSALGGVLCTQVEATGVMNDFPCLVIRGICDYADSHKTSTWQMYAATAAAVVSKQILSVTPPIEYDWGLTLLHRAAQAGNVTAVESLLESGADPNSRDIKGWIPLHYAAGRGDPKILKLLLGWRADVLLPTWSGKFARDFASVLWQKDVLNILDDPPRISAPKTQNIQECPECDPRCKTVCGSFYPRVEFYRDGPKRDHKTESKKSVHEIIYGNGLEFWEKNTRIWIHLPASNVLWVKDLIRKLCHIREKTVWECRAILDFIDESFCERRGPNFYTFCRDPSCQWDKTKTKLSLVVPYIDMESEPYLERRIPTSDHFKKMQNLMADYPSEIYSSQTLAHSYYETSANVRDRDYKQVVYQYTKGEIVDSKSNQASVTDIGPLVVVNQEEGHFPVADQKSVAKLLMVNQLWLWKIDKETVITASPERWHEGNEWTFQRELLRARPERLFESMDACVRHIVFRCINFSEEPCRAGLDHLYTAIFAYSIAGVVGSRPSSYEIYTLMNKVVRSKQML
ncbi:purine and uridine phosphorylase [Hyaloscypha hepaticicola]|uniref:Purine and uridine phosphorylase n=1 Tax=Hyaloscypha hepaticicola TaxID=2082293 RepID=A0A2J6PWT9_9HELO|nr:purine and uridine phosphorylase [Hyaloscypha hepaticicola]